MFFFRPVLAHLTALEAWVAASGAREDRAEELETVARAVEAVYDRVAAARLARKSMMARMDSGRCFTTTSLGRGVGPAVPRRRGKLAMGSGSGTSRQLGLSVMVNNRVYSIHAEEEAEEEPEEQHCKRAQTS